MQNVNDAPAPARDAVDLRNRLMAVLLSADPGLVLLQCDDTTARLVGTTAQVFLASPPEGVSPEAFETTLENMVQMVNRGSPPTALVVVGSGAWVKPLMNRAAPTVQPAPMGFYHLGPSLVLVTGRSLPLLEQVASRVHALPPVPPEVLAQALARGKTVVEHEKRVIASLNGRYGVTATLVAACVMLLGLSYLWGGVMRDQALWRMGADSAAAVRRA